MVTMGVFPAIYSTLSPKALIDGVLTQYRLESVNECLFWNRGLSDIYLVETEQQSYILKISHHHWRSQTEIQFELEFLDFLYQRQIPVAHPLKTLDDRLFVTIHAVEGDRFAALFPYAPGQVPFGDLNTTQSQILGETVAKLHQASLEFNSKTPRHPLDLEYLLDNSCQIITPYLKHRIDDLSYLQNAIATIKQKLADFPQTKPFWGVCWGDPHSGNVHFTSDDRITLFDFDQCGYGWRVFDLAKFLQVSLHAGVCRQTRDAFFSGYQTVEQLSDLEINSLQALTQASHIWTWAININAAAIHNWSRLDDFFSTKRLQKLKRLSSKDWQLF
jgi:Ser/Thr protein kinase RdoA (MazF antagonist)